jgi:hypothetical protein
VLAHYLRFFLLQHVAYSDLVHWPQGRVVPCWKRGPSHMSSGSFIHFPCWHLRLHLLCRLLFCLYDHSEPCSIRAFFRVTSVTAHLCLRCALLARGVLLARQTRRTSLAVWATTVQRIRHQRTICARAPVPRYVRLSDLPRHRQQRHVSLSIMCRAIIARRAQLRRFRFLCVFDSLAS